MKADDGDGVLRGRVTTCRGQGSSHHQYQHNGAMPLLIVLVLLGALIATLATVGTPNLRSWCRPPPGRGRLRMTPRPVFAALDRSSASLCGQFRHRRSMVTGKIRTLRVDKGFGFIKDDSGKEYFFHQSAVYGEVIDNLREGDSVEFDVGEGPKGPRAENVRRTST
jgi:CspA family cold shock protein